MAQKGTQMPRRAARVEVNTSDKSTSFDNMLQVPEKNAHQKILLRCNADAIHYGRKEPNESLTLMRLQVLLALTLHLISRRVTLKTPPRSGVLSGSNNEHCSITAPGYFTYLGT